MKCPKCKGTGRVPRPDGTELFGLTELMTCDLCHGTGEVEVTNDEWRRTCSAEDFAKFLEDVTSSCYHCGMTDDISQCAFQKHQCNIKEWLKEKHNG